jgi:hypothetical protein
MFLSGVVMVRAYNAFARKGNRLFCRREQGLRGFRRFRAPGCSGWRRRGPAYQRKSRPPTSAPTSARTATAMVYQVATKKGESSVQWAA